MVTQFFRKRLSSFRIIIFGFMGVILLGALLLMLPISVKDGHGATFENALFTSTSAVCVTGLVVKDTASYWSVFGQAVILLHHMDGLSYQQIAAIQGSTESAVRMTASRAKANLMNSLKQPKQEAS